MVHKGLRMGPERPLGFFAKVNEVLNPNSLYPILRLSWPEHGKRECNRGMPSKPAIFVNISHLPRHRQDCCSSTTQAWQVEAGGQQKLPVSHFQIQNHRRWQVQEGKSCRDVFLPGGFSHPLLSVSSNPHFLWQAWGTPSLLSVLDLQNDSSGPANGT